MTIVANWMWDNTTTRKSYQTNDDAKVATRILHANVLFRLTELLWGEYFKNKIDEILCEVSALCFPNLTCVMGIYKRIFSVFQSFWTMFSRRMKDFEKCVQIKFQLRQNLHAIAAVNSIQIDTINKPRTSTTINVLLLWHS